MSLKKQLRLPTPDECSLGQGVEWLVNREPIISTGHFFESSPKLDNAIYDEAKETLFYALHSEKMSATGQFYPDNPGVPYDPADFDDTDYPPYYTSTVIVRRLWILNSINWRRSALRTPDYYGEYREILIKTKDLFEIFGDSDAELTERNKNIETSEPDPHFSGLPGRPSKSKHLIDDEFQRRAEVGEICSTLAEQALVLLAWLKKNIPDRATTDGQDNQEQSRSRV